MVFRLLTLGLCVACVGLLAASRSVRVEVVVSAAVPEARLPRGPQLSVVDVAGDVAAAAIPALVRLDARESIVAVNDLPVTDEAELGAEIRARAAHGGFLDLTVVGDAGARRVLLLIH